MAGSTYSVNLKLDTNKVEVKLRKLKKQVDTFRKTLQEPIKIEDKAQKLEEKKRKFADRKSAQMARNRRVSDQILRLEEQGLKVDKAKAAVKRAIDRTDKNKLQTAGVNLRHAKDEVNEALKLLKIKEKTRKINRNITSDVWGSPVSMDLRRNQQRKRTGYQGQIDLLQAKGIDVSAMRKQMGRITDAMNQPISDYGAIGSEKIASVTKQGKLVKTGLPSLGKGAIDVGMLKEANRQMELLIAKAHNKLKVENASATALKKQNTALKQQSKDYLSSPIGGTKYMMGSPAQLAYSGGPSSPIAGGRGMAGSPINRAMWANVRKSALISGGFPLLFGQGPGVALGGALGGALGERVSQGGGFAGGIAATAAITAITQATQAVAGLGQAMGPFKEDVAALTRATGNMNTVRGRQIQAIEKLQGKEAAYAETMKDMEKIVGKDGVSALKRFGSDTQRLSNSWGIFMTQMGAGFAKLLNWSGLFAEGTKSKVERAKAGSFAAGGYDDAELDALVAKLAKVQSRPVGTGASGQRIRGREVRKIQWAIGKRVDELDKDPKYSQKSRLEYQDTLNQKLERTLQLQRNIGDVVKQGLVDGLASAIQGAKNLGEVLTNMLKQVGRMILQYGINSLLLSMFPGSKTWGKIFGRASGGPVTGGDPYVVGEKGPELFVPNSSGNIVPNHAMGGSMVVNVDASGSSVEGDAERSRQLGELIGAAVQSEIIRQQRPGGTLY